MVRTLRRAHPGHLSVEGSWEEQCLWCGGDDTVTLGTEKELLLPWESLAGSRMPRIRGVSARRRYRTP